MSRSRKLQVMFAHAFYDSVIFFVFLGFIFFSYGEFGELIMKLSHAALRPLLAAHARGALPLVRARGVSLRESRATMQVMPGVSLQARWTQL